MTVTVERRDTGQLALTLARPRQRNAITVAMYAALADAIEGAANDPSVRVITIEGEGEDFTAGNDLYDFLKDMPAPGTTDIPVWRFLRALTRNQVPIVAAVHGNAVGIGTTMLFHCDLVLAEEGSALRHAVRRSGAGARSGEFACSCRALPAAAPRRAICCLASRSGPGPRPTSGWSAMSSRRAGLRPRLADTVAALLAKPPEALRLTQALLRREDTRCLLERIELENGHFGERLASDEVKQAIAAFFAAKAKASA